MFISTLADQKNAVRTLMDYAVPEGLRAEALALLDKHGADIIALNIFHSFYSFLPEGEDDAIKTLRLLFRRQGAFLLCANTGLSDYLYFATSENAMFLGPLAEGVADPEVLEFLQVDDQETFIKRYGNAAEFPEYSPAYLDKELCPICLVANGELHVFGCPVEVCPWCNGQLSRCDCRFSRLGRSRLESEKLIDDLLALATEKGRVPFDAAKHRPAYLADK